MMRILPKGAAEEFARAYQVDLTKVEMPDFPTELDFKGVIEPILLYTFIMGYTHDKEGNACTIWTLRTISYGVRDFRDGTIYMIKRDYLGVRGKLEYKVLDLMFLGVERWKYYPQLQEFCRENPEPKRIFIPTIANLTEHFDYLKAFRKYHKSRYLNNIK